ncbi:MAG: PaaI family thioesterase [Rhodospirillales bacterium]|nr:PaaI family thioesterase [Rhodospirillales bacterium]
MPDSHAASAIDLSTYRIFDPSDPFEDYVGPIHYRNDGPAVHSVMPTDARHANAGGILHGGAILTFADYALCVTCGHAASGGQVPGSFAMTVSLNVQFLAPGRLGPAIESTGTATQVTGRMAFARGSVWQEGVRLATYSGVTRHISRDKAMGRRDDEGLTRAPGGTRPPGPPDGVAPPDGFRSVLRPSAFLNAIGPTFFRETDAGTHVVQPTYPHMLNSGASIHGGMLMTFADNAFCTAVASRLGKAPSTVGFTAEFLAGSAIDGPLETTVDLARATERMTFPTGVVTQNGKALLSYSAVVALRDWKRPTGADGAPA